MCVGPTCSKSAATQITEMVNNLKTCNKGAFSGRIWLDIEGSQVCFLYATIVCCHFSFFDFHVSFFLNHVSFLSTGWEVLLRIKLGTRYAHDFSFILWLNLCVCVVCIYIICFCSCCVFYFNVIILSLHFSGFGGCLQ